MVSVLLAIDAALDDECWIWERLHSFWEVNVYRATSTPNRTNRTSLSAVFHTKFTFQNWNANDHSIRTGVELRPPMSESSTKISKFYAHSDSEHKFHKARIEIWLPIGFKLRYPWLVTCSYNHRLGICWVGVPRREPAVQLLKTFHFLETVKAFSNSTTITQSNINLKQK